MNTPDVRPMTEDEKIGLLGEVEFVTDFSGFKSSEGDGRTAADIEREMEEARGSE